MAIFGRLSSSKIKWQLAKNLSIGGIPPAWDPFASMYGVVLFLVTFSLHRAVSLLYEFCASSLAF